MDKLEEIYDLIIENKPAIKEVKLDEKKQYFRKFTE